MGNHSINPHANPQNCWVISTDKKFLDQEFKFQHSRTHPAGPALSMS